MSKLAAYEGLWKHGKKKYIGHVHFLANTHKRLLEGHDNDAFLRTLFDHCTYWSDCPASVSDLGNFYPEDVVLSIQNDRDSIESMYKTLAEFGRGFRRYW
jgi:hypothetical protein